MSGLGTLTGGRPQPVQIMTTVLAVVSFLAGSAQLADLISATAMAWLVIANGALAIGWGAWTASRVTPLAAPQNAAGTPLVPLRTDGLPPVTGRHEAGAVNLIRLLCIVVLVLVIVWLVVLLF